MMELMDWSIRSVCPWEVRDPICIDRQEDPNWIWLYIVLIDGWLFNDYNISFTSMTRYVIEISDRTCCAAELFKRIEDRHVTIRPYFQLKSYAITVYFPPQSTPLRAFERSI